MKKSTKNAKRKNRNIVAKFAARFQRGRRFRDRGLVSGLFGWPWARKKFPAGVGAHP